MVINMPEFKCPVCDEILHRDNNSYKCINNHCFDIARQGYVNLLLSQKSSAKRHGDDSLMVNSRRDFLNKGYYAKLKDEITDIIGCYAEKPCVIADLGCGECYYTDFIQKSFPDAEIYGIDISKQALISASKRNKNISLAVASTTDIPLADCSCDIVVSVFAPVNYSEITRILSDKGIYIKVFPLEKHLYGLKKEIYDKPYFNEITEDFCEQLKTVDNRKIKYKIVLDNNEDIMNLFRMTPYYYKTGIKDQKKLEKLNYLETELEFGINVYTKLK